MDLKINPMLIPGRWRQGYVLDYHTLSSTHIGDDEYGHPQFDTKRTELGDLLYRLKYKSDSTVVAEIVEEVASFMSSWKPGAAVITPVPPSRLRTMQPIFIIGEALAKRIEIPWIIDGVRRIKEIPELKNVYNYDERIRLLTGAYDVDRTQIQGQRVLLFDDLYRSGATMNTVTAALYDLGGALDVFALALTRTRSNR